MSRSTAALTRSTRQDGLYAAHLRRTSASDEWIECNGEEEQREVGIRTVEEPHRLQADRVGRRTRSTPQRVRLPQEGSPEGSGSDGVEPPR